jgi:8-amino-7-oxononanoate synthase
MGARRTRSGKVSRMRDPAEELANIRAGGLLRTLRPADPSRVCFASNDYLGLSRHPEVCRALTDGVARFGAGAGSSRLIEGTTAPHLALEQELASAKGCDASLLFSSGHATALGVIPSVVGKGDFIVLDRLSHACLVDAARLSGASLKVYAHNDPDALARVLRGIRARHASARVLVATESVFSMDGDLCPLRETVETVETHGALLLLDEAHGFGVMGPTGMGLAEREGLQHRIAFQMGTLSKAAGLSGGYIAASRDWIPLFVNRARSFIYSTAPPPALAHAASASLRVIRSAEGTRLRTLLGARIARFPSAQSPVIPVLLGSNEAALNASEILGSEGFSVPAIRFPTVPKGSARLRVSLSAAHSEREVEDLAATLARIAPEAAAAVMRATRPQA